jgi:asparagine synthetase B (glutamine-hydrolysing)
MFDSSAIPAYYVTKAIRKHCTVALGGDGADEVFGGYQSNIQALRFSKYANLLRFTGFKSLSEYLLNHLSLYNTIQPTQKNHNLYIDCTGLKLKTQIQIVIADLVWLLFHPPI